MEYTRTIKVPQTAVNAIEAAIENAKPMGNGKEVLLTETVKFPDGIEADFKIVDADNGPWTEVVLFDDGGSEIACSEVGDSVLGKWELESGGNTYTINIESGTDGLPENANYYLLGDACIALNEDGESDES